MVTQRWSTRRSTIVQRLDDEWVQLVVAGGDQVVGWGRQYRCLADCDDLDDVLGSIRTDPDTVLLALLELGRSGDTLAARTVLQAMLPKMILMALRTPGTSPEEFLSELWPVIATYPTDRRRRKVAANLALDTLKQVKSVSGVAHLSWESLPELVQAAVIARGDTGPQLAGDQVVARALELQAIDLTTARALQAVYLAGMSSAAAGAALGATAQTVRYRCSRGVRRLAAQSSTLAEAS